MKLRASLRWQLQLYYFLIFFVTLAILTALSIHWMRQSELFKYDSQLRDSQRFFIPVLVGHNASDPALFRVPPRQRRPRGRLSDGSFRQPRPPRPASPGLNDRIRRKMESGWVFASWTREGELQSASRNFPDFLAPEVFPSDLREAQVEDSGGYRRLISRTPREFIVIAIPKAMMDADAQTRAAVIIGLSLVLLLISTSVGWALIGRALRPLREIEDTAQAIACGQLDRRIAPTAQPDNEIGGLVGNLNQTFRQLEAMFERQARFTSDASHELRTPIAVILNHCQHGLSKERSSQEYREALGACQRAGERMRNLTASLLELARLESGEIQLEREPCALGEIAREALELVEPLALSKGVELREEIGEITVRANADRLWQVMVNLLHNAIQYTPGGKAVTLRLERSERHAVISVIDEGEGVPAESLPHLFERFYRVDKSRARSQEQGGFGLGLAICDTIVKAHGGAIEV
ncbi:MAG: ATP-binding protein, partial [Verrucomicrobiota bacterium]